MTRIKNVIFDYSIFRTAYIISLFFSLCSGIRKIADPIFYICFAWGFILVIYKSFFDKKVTRVRYFGWIAAFLGMSLITAFFHIMDNFGMNFVMFMHASICFFIFYGMHTERNFDKVKQEMYNIALFVVVATAILNLTAIILFLFGVYGEYFGEVFIIYKNRFTGIFINPNLAAFISVTALFFCQLFLIKKGLPFQAKKKDPPKWLLIVSIIINLSTVFLSDSNGGILLLILYAVLSISIIIIRDIRKQKDKKKTFTRAASLVLISAVMASGALGLRELCKITAVNVSRIGYRLESGMDDLGEVPDEELITFDHVNENVDSGRLLLIQQAAVLVYNSPIFGIGNGNIVEYGDRLLKDGLRFNDLHNGYLTILVSGGLVGFLLFIVFGYHCAKYMAIAVFIDKWRRKNAVFPFLVAFLTAYCVYSVIEIALLYSITYVVVFFWLILGYASCYVNSIENSIGVEYQGGKAVLKVLAERVIEEEADAIE